jgi:glycine cleavage system aminomethyltransferase T
MARKILIGLGMMMIHAAASGISNEHESVKYPWGFDLVISRTGYTGEKFSFEIFVHPGKAEELFNALLEIGKHYGIKPCGLGA